MSKTKPIEDILTAYDAGHRKFGENYVDEFLDKVQHINPHPSMQNAVIPSKYQLDHFAEKMKVDDDSDSNNSTSESKGSQKSS